MCDQLSIQDTTVQAATAARIKLSSPSPSTTVTPTQLLEENNLSFLAIQDPSSPKTSDNTSSFNVPISHKRSRSFVEFNDSEVSDDAQPSEDFLQEEDIDEQELHRCKRRRLSIQTNFQQPRIPATPLPHNEEAESLRQQVDALKEECQSRTQELETLKQKHAASSKLISSAKELEQDLMCPICQELVFKAVTLHCSHTFCNGCLKQWVKTPKRNCPVCRKTILAKPVPNKFVDNCIDKLACCLNEEEFKIREQKMRTALEEETRAVTHLEVLVQQAKEKNIALLNVREPWNQDEKLVFANQSKKYQGKARKLFFSLTGFTECFVRKATPEEIARACSNFGIQCCMKLVRLNPTVPTQQIQTTQVPDYDLTKEKLLEFMECDLF